MDTITYIGEHAWAGRLGHFFTLLSFGAALLSTVAYVLATNSNDAGWRKVGRIGFRTHSLAVLGIVVLLFIMLFNHWFEFDYVWKHSNLQMPLEYIASCFWEGQEGSFLLWTFWHVVLGNLLIAKAGKWEAPVLAIFALVQVFLASMLLGIHIFDYRLGSSPFMLIRELGDNVGLPWTLMPDYLQVVPEFADGRGLNPLLQNYWMVIHPPTLFLGFGLSLVPYAYAVAGLWTGRHKEWMTPALSWTFAGVMVLGVGILMGGAWAYEALSFGGFWAWDPVENASLVPWILLVAAGHLMLINRRKPTSLFTTYLLTMGAFLLVLYSTFLTRSGVLGDTSVHSFTGEGMLPGLLIFMLSFLAIGVTLLNTDRSNRIFYVSIALLLLVMGIALRVYVPAILLFMAVSLLMTWTAFRKGPYAIPEEENIMSREFWLFIGSLILLLSALQVSFSTSMPVFNLLLEPFQSGMASLAESTGWNWLENLSTAKLAPPSDANAHYNKWQLPFAVIVSLLMAFGQFLRYRDTDRKTFLLALLVPLAAAVAITVVGVLMMQYGTNELSLITMLFATAFAVTANLWYIPRVLRGKLRLAGPSVAHTGFGLLLLGALISMSRQHPISRNVTGPMLQFLNEDFSDNQDMLLYIGDTLPIGERFVVFHGKRFEGHNIYFDMDYLTAEPTRYAAGDTVRVRSALFTAKRDHTAGSLFLTDQPENWEPVETYTRGELWKAKHWRPRTPGANEFALAPYLQINPRFGNVPEPSTKHWLQRDLYTHIRYARQDTISDGYMPPRLYEKQVGDTIITPTCVIVIDTVRAVRDSVTISRLGPDFTVYLLNMKVRDLYDDSRWFEAKPVVIYHNDEPVGNKGFDLPQLNARFDLESVRGNTVGVNVSEREFVIMKAIVFPGINILWIGCILMALGTLMAVVQRIRQKA